MAAVLAAAVATCCDVIRMLANQEPGRLGNPLAGFAGYPRLAGRPRVRGWGGYNYIAVPRKAHFNFNFNFSHI